MKNAVSRRLRGQPTIFRNKRLSYESLDKREEIHMIFHPEIDCGNLKMGVGI